jgi:SnoaL-like domain
VPHIRPWSVDVVDKVGSDHRSSYCQGLLRGDNRRPPWCLTCSVFSFSTESRRDTTIPLCLRRARRDWRNKRLGAALGAAVVDRFVDTIQEGDLDQVLALLTNDARLKMPPEPFEFYGPRPIAQFLRQVAFWGEDLKMVQTRANNNPAFGYYRKDPNASVYRASGLMVLAVSEDKIAAMTRFGDKSLFACFGLPLTIPAAT